MTVFRLINRTCFCVAVPVLGLALPCDAEKPDLSALPFDRATKFRLEHDDQLERRVLKFDGKTILTNPAQPVTQDADGTIHVDSRKQLEARYHYNGELETEGGKIRKIRGWVDFNKGAFAIRQEHWKLRGKIRFFHDFIEPHVNLKSGMIASDGRILSEMVFDDIRFLGAGYLLAKKDDRELVFDMKLKPIFSKPYEEISYLGNDRFGVKLKGHAGVIDVNGKVIIPLEHEEVIADYVEDVHLFGKQTKAGVINNRGEVVFEPRFKIWRRPDSAHGRVFVIDTQTGEKGVITRDCRYSSNKELTPYLRRWKVDRRRGDIDSLHAHVRERWLADVSPETAKAMPFPDPKSFTIELELKDDFQGALKIHNSTALVKWRRSKRGLELETAGYLRGIARVHLESDGGLLVYTQVENRSAGGEPLDGKPVPSKPLYFVSTR